jgi:hypothetical protein
MRAAHSDLATGRRNHRPYRPLAANFLNDDQPDSADDCVDDRSSRRQNGSTRRRRRRAIDSDGSI